MTSRSYELGTMNSVLSWIFEIYSFYTGKIGALRGWGGRARGIRYFAEIANIFNMWISH
jgi:hypothetical protein